MALQSRLKIATTNTSSKTPMSGSMQQIGESQSKVMVFRICREMEKKIG